MRVALAAEGDAETSDCWSGAACRFVAAMRRKGVEVNVINAELGGVQRLWAALLSWRPQRRRWRQRFLFGNHSSRLRSRKVGAELRRMTPPPDVIIQVGAGFNSRAFLTHSAPTVLFADANAAFASRGEPFSGISQLNVRERTELIAREAEIYAQVDRIWCWSRALEHSFRVDFAQPAQKLTVIPPGANTFPADEILSNDRTPVPSVLFVGKDHERKGSQVLLEAWPAVRKAVPTAELHFVGCAPPGAHLHGIHTHGFIPTSSHDGQRRLASLYSNATVFCLPSLYEPFGIVFAEAMMAGLPCIGTSAWAMPEIIVPGETGWLVPAGSATHLAAALIDSLKDPERSRRMGRAGRDRAERFFTWDRAADAAVANLTDVLRTPH